MFLWLGQLFEYRGPRPHSQSRGLQRSGGRKFPELLFLGNFNGQVHLNCGVQFKLSLTGFLLLEFLFTRWGVSAVLRKVARLWTVSHRRFPLGQAWSVSLGFRMRVNRMDWTRQSLSRGFVRPCGPIFVVFQCLLLLLLTSCSQMNLGVACRLWESGWSGEAHTGPPLYSRLSKVFLNS